MCRAIGYAYDAAMHCPDCAEKAGMTGDDPIPLDSEGNEVGVLFSTDDPSDSDACDECGINLWEN